MMRLGLTGSIGMGKSTAAKMMVECAIPVHDSDAAVARLYLPGGLAVSAVAELAPQAVRDGAVDREALKAAVTADASLLQRLEAVVHPLVAQDRISFDERAAKAGAAAVCYDIPLLFESGAERVVDRIIVVSAPEAVQRRRVLARRGMTPALFEKIRGRQTPDAEKRRRADVVLESGGSFNEMRAQLRAYLRSACLLKEIT